MLDLMYHTCVQNLTIDMRYGWCPPKCGSHDLTTPVSGMVWHTTMKEHSTEYMV